MKDWLFLLCLAAAAILGFREWDRHAEHASARVPSPQRVRALLSPQDYLTLDSVPPAPKADGSEVHGPSFCVGRTVFLLRYVSARTSKGVVGIDPGEEVTIKSVEPAAGMLTVSDGTYTAKVPFASVTEDQSEAVAAQRADHADQVRAAASRDNQLRAWNDAQLAAAVSTAKDLEQANRAQVSASWHPDTSSALTTTSLTSGHPTSRTSTPSSGGARATICGHVMQKVSEGLLVQCAEDAEERRRIPGAPRSGFVIGAPLASGVVLLVDDPSEDAMADEDPVANVIAADSGTYRYDAVNGATKTVRKFRYVNGR